MTPVVRQLASMLALALASAVVAQPAGRTRPTQELFDEGTALVRPFFLITEADGSLNALPPDDKVLARGVALLEEVGRREPAFWPTFWCLGKAAQARGRLGEAYEHFARAWALNPLHPDVARELAGECLALGKGAEAVRVERVAVALSPLDAGLHANLALALLVAGQVHEARKEVERALMLAPSDPITQNVSRLIRDVQAGKARRPTRIEHPSR